MASPSKTINEAMVKAAVRAMQATEQEEVTFTPSDVAKKLAALGHIPAYSSTATQHVYKILCGAEANGDVSELSKRRFRASNAWLEDDENEQTSLAEQNRVPDSASDENEQTSLAEQNRVPDSTSDDNEQTSLAEQNRVPDSTSDENEQTSLAEQNRVPDSASDENEQTSLAEQNRVPDSTSDENEQTSLAEQNRVPDSTSDETEQTSLAEQNRVPDSASDENEQTSLAEQNRVPDSTSDETEQTSLAEQNRVPDSTSDENEQTSLAEQNRVPDSTSDETEQTSLAEQNRVPDSASDENEQTSLAEQNRVPDSTSDETEQTSLAEQNRVPDSTSDEAEQTSLAEQNRVPDSTSDETEQTSLAEQNRVPDSASNENGPQIVDKASIVEFLRSAFSDSSEADVQTWASIIWNLRLREMAELKTKTNIVVEGAPSAGKTYIDKMCAAAQRFIPSLKHAKPIIYLAHEWPHVSSFNESYSNCPLRALDECAYFIDHLPLHIAATMDQSNNDYFPVNQPTILSIWTGYVGGAALLLASNDGFLRRQHLTISLPAPSDETLAHRFISQLGKQRIQLATTIAAMDEFRLATTFYGSGAAFRLRLVLSIALESAPDTASHDDILKSIMLSAVKEDLKHLKRISSPSARVLEMLAAARKATCLLIETDD